MEIFLLILKIIGIILLSILGLLLFIILVALITPIRYRLKGSYKEDEPDVLLNIHLWFHLISAKVVYTEAGLGANLRIFFIKKTIISPDKKENQEQTELSDIDMIQQALDEMEEETQTQIENTTEATGDSESENTEEEKTESETEAEGAEENSEVKPENETEEPSEENQDEAQAEEPQSLVDKIVDKVKGIYTKVHDLYEKIMKKKTAVEWLLKQESTQRLIKRAVKQLIKTIKSILPRRFKGYLNLGLEDPKTMGTICMYTSVFYPSFPKNFEFNPIFGEKVIDGDADIKGRIILGALLGHLLKIVLCRDFFKTLKNLKRFKKLWR